MHLEIDAQTYNLSQNYFFIISNWKAKVWRFIISGLWVLADLPTTSQRSWNPPAHGGKAFQ